MARFWDQPVGRNPSLWQRLTPPQLFALSFAALVLLGTIGLKTLPGLYTGEPLGWLDALFTSTSAVCVTGLIVVDTATYFTFYGQAYILTLVQIGGLGMLAFTTQVFLTVGSRMTLRQAELSTGSPLDPLTYKLDPRRLARDVIVFTLACEAVGAALLYLLWVPEFGWVGAAWPAVFHSVSAFCNAGFSINSDSLVRFAGSPGTITVISSLVMVGGLGFLTLEELFLRAKTRRRGRAARLSLHTRVVLASTLVVTVGGWAVYLVLEWNACLGPLPVDDKLTNALFMTATSRVAGYNTVDYGQATEAGNFFTILLMSIGGAPGGTAGGMKITTFALLGILAWSRYRGQEVGSVLGRSLRKETTDRAVGLFVIGFGLMTAGILALTVTEANAPEWRFISRMFEAVSAFNIVGLSLGHTPDLSPAGRVVVIGMMYVGRVGPLALAAALTRHAPAAGKFRYAYEEVAVG